MPRFPTRPIARLGGHNGIVHVVAYSSGSSDFILTGSSDRTIRLFNISRAPVDSKVPNAGLVKKFSAHGHEVLSIAVSQGNDKFISTGGDKTVFFWDVATAQTLRTWRGHGGRVNACAFGGEDESVVVTGSWDGTVKIWDVKSNNPKPIITLNDAKDSISDVCVFDADIISGSVDGRVRHYDLRMGMCNIDAIGHPVTSLAVTKKGTETLVSSLDSTVRLMDRDNGQLLKAYRDESFVNTDLKIKSTLGLNDSVVVSGSDNGMVYAWDLLEGEVLHKFNHSERQEVKGKKPSAPTSGKKDVVSAVAFCKTRQEWASGGGDGDVIVWGAE
ncbi:WD40 repeat-like protein [Lindgomyces ingoldianus]|uniref:WD40 repeat-like protein n=1 Tax=Lindgomyces ingoldianus TaxID=673940 RepID=A0ACB6QE02_9PLEO|nr:WD40 repeat-like protein [Lindgomyces ingoldianus]KAF2465208.1 WD40 repeat-like protein [Lindgomyces ingoldianus]